MKNPIKIFTNGIFKENPLLVMLLGICAALAVTTSLINGLGMGIATTFVLICSNVAISVLKKVIPAQVRLPCYIVLIAGFVTIVEMMLGAFNPLNLYDSLGIFLPLIVCNCIVLSRAEIFASKNNPALSALDGLGMGIGFTLALSIIGVVREILGSGILFMGTGFEIAIPVISDNPMTIFIFPAGGFFTFAIVIAVVNKLTKKSGREIGCKNCPLKSTCGTRMKESDSQ